MKKIVFLVMLMAGSFAQGVSAQSVADGVKFLSYESTRQKSAMETLQKAYNSNPSDPKAVYWYAQVLMEDKKNAEAKAIAEKALQAAPNDPLLMVLKAHTDVANGGDFNAAKQAFEQAITLSTEAKGKNKGRINPDILNAIGHAVSEFSAKQSDPLYGIEKLKQAAGFDLTNPDIFINMGICYLRMGGEYGGEAVKAFTEALTRDPKNARAMYRIGNIYYSQQNKELYEKWFGDALLADPGYAPVYLKFYNYYSDKNVNIAKEYIEKYLANSDKDCSNDYFYAEYLFRAGKYQESLDKAKEMKSAACKDFYATDLLFAYNSDRLGDSIAARDYLKSFFAAAPVDKLSAQQYEFAATVFGKIAGEEKEASAFVEKAMELETLPAAKLAIAAKAAESFRKAKKYTEQLKWLQTVVKMRGGAPTEGDYFGMTNAALSAKDYAQTIELAKGYMAAFPDKSQPYTFYKRAAMQISTDSSVIVEQLNYLDSVYAAVNLDKYKKDIFLNSYFKLNYYVSKFNNLKKNPDFKVKSDGTRTAVVDEFLATCQKAVEVADKMIQLYPDPNDDNNKFANENKAAIMKNIEYYSKPQGKGGAPAAKQNGNPK